MWRRLLLALAVLHTSRGCQEISGYFGTLDASSELAAHTLTDSGSSCQCCALCHAATACKSLSFDTSSQRCTLYGKVASYADFRRQHETEHTAQYFLMPGKSLSGEFCRRDADCLADGDLCRGRVCTTDSMLTCRDLHRANPALPDHRYWSLLDGQQVLVYCRMQAGFEGATLLLAYQASAAVPWSYGNLQDKPTDSPSETEDFSILK